MTKHSPKKDPHHLAQALMLLVASGLIVFVVIMLGHNFDQRRPVIYHTCKDCDIEDHVDPFLPGIHGAMLYFPKVCHGWVDDMTGICPIQLAFERCLDRRHDPEGRRYVDYCAARTLDRRSMLDTKLPPR